MNLPELCYKGVEIGDRVEVIYESVNPNCDGWGRDLPRMPWNETSYTGSVDYGTVQLAVSQDGSRAELRFISKTGWSNFLSSFDQVKKITEAEWDAGEKQSTSYEKDKDGKRVPCGTAKREYCREGCK